MIFVNRYVDAAGKYEDGQIPIDQVFRDADIEESVQIVEAMYVIAERRAASGKPLDISEISTGIPGLVKDSVVLEAAIDICLDGLIAKGLSQDDAYQALLESTANSFKDSDIQSASEIDSLLQRANSKYTSERRLPQAFGKADLDGQKRYELRRCIGSGSQGTMYEAVDCAFGEVGQPAHVAIKISHEDVEESVCIREGSRARRVRHKNVVQVLDCGVDDQGDPYLVYEYIDGLPLDLWIKNLTKPLSTDEACGIVSRIAHGIQAAHNAGVIHRDIKPSNIMVNRLGEPMITDFGIAYAEVSHPRYCSQYGTRGSLAFMAPEQYHTGNDGLRPSVDTYALGGLLYWLLTDQFPNGSSVMDALTRLDNRNEGGVARFYPDHISTRIRRIIDRALSADLMERYSSAGAFASDLDSFVAHQPIDWLDESWVIRSELFAKRNPLALGLNLAIMFLIAFVVAVWANSQSKIQLEKARAAAELHAAQLGAQVELEQDRVRQLNERNIMAKSMLQAWSQAADHKGDEILATANLLFLYSVSTSGFLDGDPEMVDKMLNRRVEVAESYLATLTPENSSPIQRAQWHEMLGVWYAEQGSRAGKVHINEALRLVTEFAPMDSIWRDRLVELQASSI